MNKQAVLDLAQFMEDHEELPYDQWESAIPSECGTAGCIAGFAALYFKTAVPPFRMELALEIPLKISRTMAKAIYCAFEFSEETGPRSGEYLPMEFITRKMAVAMLRRLAETEAVVWHKADDPEGYDEKVRELAANEKVLVELP